MNGLGIREIRKAVGLSAEELGNAIGMNPAYLLRIENGNVENPSFPTVMKLAKYISEMSVIKEREVDLTDYNSMFSKLIMSFHYDEVEEAYQYSKDNENISLHMDMTKYLTASDLDSIRALTAYRKLDSMLKSSKIKLEESIINKKEVYKNEISANSMINNFISESNVVYEVKGESILEIDLVSIVNEITNSINKLAQNINEYEIDPEEHRQAMRARFITEDGFNVLAALKSRQEEKK